MPRALVTGSSSGIGRAVAERLLDDGWQVTGVDRADASIERPDFVALAVDLIDAASASRLDDALAADGFDAFVHAAGILNTGVLGALDTDAGRRMWALHVDAATRIADALLPAMRNRKSGRIVLIGSRVASGMPGRSQYAATKAALVSLARSWAAEAVTSGITVNVVAPAATDTAMLRDPSRAASTPKLPPIGRLIRPDEVASLVAYLLSPAAAAITGQEIAICGGSSLPR